LDVEMVLLTKVIDYAFVIDAGVFSGLVGLE
jgi:hypothetical protein